MQESNSKLKEELGEDFEVEADEHFQHDRFIEHVGDRADKLCDEWFTDDEIEFFIKENFKSAETEHEHMVDDIIQKIQVLNPETMDYYYRFPKKWEDSGLVQRTRDTWGLPDIDEYHQLLCDYEEDEEE